MTLLLDDLSVQHFKRDIQRSNHSSLCLGELHPPTMSRLIVRAIRLEHVVQHRRQLGRVMSDRLEWLHSASHQPLVIYPERVVGGPGCKQHEDHLAESTTPGALPCSRVSCRSRTYLNDPAWGTTPRRRG